MNTFTFYYFNKNTSNRQDYNLSIFCVKYKKN